MAFGDLFHPAGTTRDIKVRGPVWVGLWSLTGVYAIYWMCVTARDLSEYGKAKGRDYGQNPTNTILAFLIGWIIIVPPIVALYRQAKRIQQAQADNGLPVYNGWLALVLYLVLSPLYFAYEQTELNKVWAVEGGPVPLDAQPAGQHTLQASAPTPEHSFAPPTATPSPLDTPERPGS